MATAGDTCALQIRLFDGSAIRKIFSSNDTLSKDVRAWIDTEQKLWQPYQFKQIQAPSRTIHVGEEEETLQELGLMPNATLVLVPVQKFNSAYASGSGVRGVVTGAASAGVGLVGEAVEGAMGLLGWGAKALGSVLGGTSTTSSSSPTTPVNGGSQAAGHGSSDKEGNQFYNGNSVSTAAMPDVSSLSILIII